MFRKIAGGMLAVAGIGLIFAAPAEATKNHEKPWICHPVEGKGQTGTGWNLIKPDEASEHIDEATGAGKHTRKDGRTDVYAVNGVCPAAPVPSTSTTTQPTTTTSTTTEPTTPTETETTQPTKEPTKTTEPTTQAPSPSSTTEPPVVVTDPRPSVTLPEKTTVAPKPSKTSEIVVSHEDSTPTATQRSLRKTYVSETPAPKELAYTGAKMLYAIAGLILVAAGVLLLFLRRGLTLVRK